MEDYRLGRSVNYNPICSRIFVNMSEVSGEDYFGGKVQIAYAEKRGNGTVVKTQIYRSGRGEDNRYNRWFSGDDLKGRIRRDYEFKGFFQDSNIGSLILHVRDIDRKTLGDGKEEYIGEGHVWFKMFRGFAGRGDTECYLKGAYVTQLRNAPPLPSIKCWLITRVTPYNCRTFLKSGKIDITRDEDPKCYSYLGEFGNLNVEEAFNAEVD